MTFKNIAAIIITVGLVSCSKNELPVCHEEEFGVKFSISAEQSYCFDDNTELKIVSLNNNFCPCDVICFWEGQMTITMEWTLPNGEKLEYLYNTAEDFIENEPLPNGLTISYMSDEFTLAEECTEAVPLPEITEARITVSK